MRWIVGIVLVSMVCFLGTVSLGLVGLWNFAMEWLGLKEENDLDIDVALRGGTDQET